MKNKHRLQFLLWVEVLKTKVFNPDSPQATPLSVNEIIEKMVALVHERKAEEVQQIYYLLYDVKKKIKEIIDYE